MKIKDINIPSEHRYLSELMDFLPGNCILNKGMCGCGGTPIYGLYILLKQKKDMGNSSPCPFLCSPERIYNVYLYTLSNSCVSCVSSLCSRSISYRITYRYRSSIFCHLEYMILYVILQKSPDL